VFGEVASTYDEIRASYPDATIDRVVELTSLSGPCEILDVGCGTGILSEAFIGRSHKVLGIEPSSEMAAMARRKFAGNPNFRLHLVDFQAWSPGRERFDLVVAGQSWHWMDPATRFADAAAALRDTGHLGLFWNTPQPLEATLQDALDEAYAEHAPGMLGGPPGSKAGLGGNAPDEEIEQADRFELVEVVEHQWTRRYDSQAYAKLLSTQSDHRLLNDAYRDALLGAIADVIDDIGDGTITVPYVCRAYVARLS